MSSGRTTVHLLKETVDGKAVAHLKSAVIAFLLIQLHATEPEVGYFLVEEEKIRLELFLDLKKVFPNANIKVNRTGEPLVAINPDIDPAEADLLYDAYPAYKAHLNMKPPMPQPQTTHGENILRRAGLGFTRAFSDAAKSAVNKWADFAPKWRNAPPAESKETTTPLPTTSTTNSPPEVTQQLDPCLTKKDNIAVAQDHRQPISPDKVVSHRFKLNKLPEFRTPEEEWRHDLKFLRRLDRVNPAYMSIATQQLITRGDGLGLPMSTMFQPKFGFNYFRSMDILCTRYFWLADDFRVIEPPVIRVLAMFNIPAPVMLYIVTGVQKDPGTGKSFDPQELLNLHNVQAAAKAKNIPGAAPVAEHS